MNPRMSALAACALMAATRVSAQPLPPPPLIPAVTSTIVFNGVATTAGGRVFLSYPRQEKAHGIEVGEIVQGKPSPFPSTAWNSWTPGRDGTEVFVWANAVRVGPDGDLWVVDAGAPGIGATRVAGGPKAVQIDLQTNTVRRIYPLQAATSPNSYVDDIRFNGTLAYLTDAGTPGGIIVLDLQSGAARRVLNGDKSVTAQVPLTGAGGKHLVDEHGKPVITNADQLEVSPDGQWLYYQPCTGPMHRIATRYLNDATLNDTALSQDVELFARTGATGGTALDAAGNLYVSQVDKAAIVKITPQGEISTLVQDPRLDWVDAMWIDDQGNLWAPAAQLDRTKGMNGGVSTVKFPTTVYKIPIGMAPERR